jgi:hypothetical protein
MTTILAGQRPVVGVQQRQVDPDPPVGDEVPPGHPVVVPVRPQTYPDRHVPGAVAELHPHVPVRRLLPRP